MVMEESNKSVELQDELELELDEDISQEDGMFEHYRYLVDKGQSMLRVDKYLTAHIEKTSRNRIQMAIDAGYVRVNDKIVKANYKVKPNDLITIMMPYQKRETEIRGENIPLEVMYEDKHLLIINKPAGLVVHPGHGHFSGTLVNALAYYLGVGVGILVHRIDKNTSGLLVVAKDEESQMGLSTQFFYHTIERKYIAIVWGNVKEDSGTIVGNIGRDPNDRMKYKVFPNGETGKHAVTHYRVIERFGYVTLIECKLETGRTHQIRVHMNYLGHPLFNDDRYGGDRILNGAIYSKYKQFIDNCFKILPRHALHAQTLGFKHPVTGEHIFVENQLPSDMVELINKWRKYSMVKELEE